MMIFVINMVLSNVIQMGFFFFIYRSIANKYTNSFYKLQISKYMYTKPKRRVFSKNVRSETECTEKKCEYRIL